MNESTKKLKLTVIWKDDQMFELQVTATNGRYSGMTQVYETQEALMKFANTLTGFPNGRDKLVHSCGQTGEEGYAFFKMSFRPLDATGKVTVSVQLEENVTNQSRSGERDRLKLELLTEPWAIDVFQKELATLAKTESGTAELVGI